MPDPSSLDTALLVVPILMATSSCVSPALVLASKSSRISLYLSSRASYASLKPGQVSRERRRNSSSIVAAPVCSRCQPFLTSLILRRASLTSDIGVFSVLLTNACSTTTRCPGREAVQSPSDAFRPARSDLEKPPAQQPTMGHSETRPPLRQEVDQPRIVGADARRPTKDFVQNPLVVVLDTVDHDSHVSKSANCGNRTLDREWPAPCTHEVHHPPTNGRSRTRGAPAMMANGPFHNLLPEGRCYYGSNMEPWTESGDAR